MIIKSDGDPCLDSSVKRSYILDNIGLITPTLVAPYKRWRCRYGMFPDYLELRHEWFKARICMQTFILCTTTHGITLNHRIYTHGCCVCVFVFISSAQVMQWYIYRGVIQWHRDSIQHDDVSKWTHLRRNWPFVRGIHRSPVNSLHKSQWRWALMFPMICAWINGWVNNRRADDLRHYRAHYFVIVMKAVFFVSGR